MNVVVDEPDLISSIDIHQVLSRIGDGRWWVSGSVALFTAVAVAMALLITPVYRVTIVVAPASVGDRGTDVLGFSNSALGGLASAAGLGLGSRDSGTQEALAVLKSRGFTEDFITSRNLMPELFAGKWDSHAGSWKDGKGRRPTLADGFRLFDNNIRSVIEDRRTGLITLQVDWTDRNEAAVWATDMIRLVNTEMRARAVQNADASLKFLDQELRSTTAVEARDAISRLIESQVKERMIADVTPDYSFRVVDRAIASDGAEPIRPRKALFFAGGPLIGFAFGICLALLFCRSPESHGDR